MINIPEIIGQDVISDFFGRTIGSGRIPHAIIISGERESGKLALAKAFAMEALSTDNPNHKDIRVIEFSKTNPKYIDTIREEVVNDMLLLPFGDDYKFYIIKEAGTLSSQAQNALLKSLEEPPEYAHIILLTDDAGKILPTIRSRSVYLYVKPINIGTIQKELIKRGVEESTAVVSARLSMGNLRKAIDYAENPENIAFAREVCDVFKSIAGKEHPPLFYHGKMDGFRKQPNKFMELMEIFLRDVLLYKVAKNSDYIVSPWKDNIKAISTKCSYDRLGKIRENLWSLKNAAELKIGFDNLFDILFTEIGGSY